MIGRRSFLKLIGASLASATLPATATIYTAKAVEERVPNIDIAAWIVAEYGRKYREYLDTQILSGNGPPQKAIGE